MNNVIEWIKDNISFAIKQNQVSRDTGRDWENKR